MIILYFAQINEKSPYFSLTRNDRLSCKINQKKLELYQKIY